MDLAAVRFQVTVTTAICVCGTVWTSRQHDARGTRTVRIPFCAACTDDPMTAGTP